MNKLQEQLQVALADSIQTNLGGLNEKSAKKLHKTIIKAAQKMADKYARLLGKERKGGKKADLAATQAALKKATRRATKAAPIVLNTAARKKPAVLVRNQG